MLQLVGLEACGFVSVTDTGVRLHDLFAALASKLASEPAAAVEWWCVEGHGKQSAHWLRADARVVELAGFERVSLGQSSLPRLRALSLQGVELQSDFRWGPIPTCLSNISLNNPQTLHLCRGSAGLACLAAVRDLRINVQQLAVAGDWTALTSLQRLDIQVSTAALPADLQHSLSSLSSLQHLILACSNHELPGISSLCRLSCLSLGQCRQLQQLPGCAGLTRLQRLDLSQTLALQSLPEDFSSLSQLTWVDVTGSSVSISQLLAAADQSALQALHIVSSAAGQHAGELQRAGELLMGRTSSCVRGLISSAAVC